MYKKPSQEEMNKRRELYAALRKQYLEEVWNGEANEISDTLDCYEESVIRYGEGFDTSWLFFMDELKYTYGEYELIKEILNIVNKED
jgi:hypothetical protein